MFLKENYNNIIGVVCQALNVDKSILKKYLEESDNEYLLLLLLNKYNCMNPQALHSDFNLENIYENNKEAEQRFFIDKDFRNEYFNLLEYFNENII